MKINQLKYVLFIFIQSVVYGIGNPMTKVAFRSITPLWMLTARFMLASILFMLFAGKQILSQLKCINWNIWLPPSLCCAGAYISCNIALNLTAATNVGFIMSLPVLFAPILSVLVLHRHYETKRIPIQIMIIIGLFLLCSNGGEFSFGWGEVFALIDALCLAGLLVFGEQAMTQMDVLSLTGFQVIITAVISLAGAIVFEDASILPTVHAEAWLVTLYLACICTIVAYLLQNAAVNHLSATTVSMLQCTQPIFTAIISFVILGEILSGRGFFGAVVILICLLADSWTEKEV